MRKTTLSGASLLALFASIATAAAAPITFSYTGMTVTYTVQTAGLYDILVLGAQGGNGTAGEGGFGAEIGGDVTLTQGEMLTIAVGGQGENGLANTSNVGGGGGGGTFVVANGVPLMIAGGGGGGGSQYNGGGGQVGSGDGSGGSGGILGGGGGGFLTNGGSNGGASFLNGLAGGSGMSGGGNGGFGGGGGGGFFGGGGGGYSGASDGNGASGGGSYNSALRGSDFIELAHQNSGDGLVTLNLLGVAVTSPTAVPEPGSFAALGAGLVGLMTARRRRSQVPRSPGES